MGEITSARSDLFVEWMEDKDGRRTKADRKESRDRLQEWINESNREIARRT